MFLKAFEIKFINLQHVLQLITVYCLFFSNIPSFPLHAKRCAIYTLYSIGRILFIIAANRRKAMSAM